MIFLNVLEYIPMAAATRRPLIDAFPNLDRITTIENTHGREEAPKRFERIVKMALTITGMHCDACVEAVRAALTRVPGILESDIRLGDVVVTFDEAKAGRADILAAIRNAGAFDISGFSTSP